MTQASPTQPNLFPLLSLMSTDGWIRSRLQYVRHEVAKIWRKHPNHQVCTLYNPQTNSIQVHHGPSCDAQESDMFLVSEVYEYDIREDLADVPYQMLHDLADQLISGIPVRL